MKFILNNVEHIYEYRGGERIHSLGGITLSIEQSELLSIVGVSGSGKTTLLNILAGFLKCTKGQVLKDGDEIQEPGNDRVMIFQNDAVFPWYTVEQNIRFGLQFSPQSVQKTNNERVNSLLHSIGLEHRRDAYPIYLSGGERKRVELARSFVMNPEIILADEPFGDLDPFTKHHLQELLLSLWEKSKNTIVLTTHDIEEALLLSDRIVILSPSPAVVREIVDVPFPRPRSLEIRFQRDFIELREHIESLLENRLLAYAEN